ncbi:MAG: glycosyltransferase family 2 protein [Deltaproteobacteria bacterium]|nr:glycosyltransferase family 2 protein [Deltaproteobacteria bacterium]
MTYLSLIIPAYNEESCLEKNSETVLAYLDALDRDYELIFVDDGSRDSTPSIIERIVKNNPQCRSLSNPTNRGKGNAVRRGVLAATGKYVIFVDADLAVPIGFVAACLSSLEAMTPVVIGSRHLPSSSFKVREGPLRQVCGEVYRRFARLSLGLRVSDITCGLKGFEREAATDIFSRSKIDRWGYDVEIIFLAHKLKYVIEEVPVDWYHSFDSKVSVGIDAIRTFTEMCRVCYYYISKGYEV